MRPIYEVAVDCIAVAAVLLAVFVVSGNARDLCDDIAKPLHETKRRQFDYAATASPTASAEPSSTASTSKAAEKPGRAQFWEVDCAESLNAAAQARAQKLAEADSKKPGLSEAALTGVHGENVFFIPGSKEIKKEDVEAAEKIKETAIEEAIEQWFAEIRWYDFAKPVIPAAKGQLTGHFTAMVWKDVHAMGIGVDIAPKTGNVYVVATYLSTPNVGNTEEQRGIYIQNVPPPFDNGLKARTAAAPPKSTGQIGSDSRVPLETVISTLGKLMPSLRIPKAIKNARKKIARIAMYICENRLKDELKKLLTPKDKSDAKAIDQKTDLKTREVLCLRETKNQQTLNEYKHCVKTTAKSHNIDYFLDPAHKVEGIEPFAYDYQIAQHRCESDREKRTSALKSKEEYHAGIIAVLETMKKEDRNDDATVLIATIEEMVVDEINDRKDACKRPERVALFYGGGTGAGKTSVAREVFKRDKELTKLNESKDCPIMMIAHDYYMSLVERYLKRCASSGKESCFLYQFNMPVGGMVSRMLQLAIKSKINFIWDGTLTNVNRAIGFKNKMVLQAPEVSYQIHIIGIVADSIVAAMRTWRRACAARESVLLRREGQQPTFTSHCSVYGSFRDFKQVWEEIVTKFSVSGATTFHLYDNSIDGKPAQVLYEPDPATCVKDMSCEARMQKAKRIGQLLLDEKFFTPAVFEIELLKRDKDMLENLLALDKDCNLCGGRNLAEFYLGKDALKDGFEVSEERLTQIRAVLPNIHIYGKCADEEGFCKHPTADDCLDPKSADIREKCPVSCGRCYPQNFKRVKN